MGNTIKFLQKEDINTYYDFKETLGTGSFAVVKKAVRKKDGMVFAVKIIKKKNLTAEELETLDDEIGIMHKIKHKNIVGLYEFYETNKSICMVLEYLSGGELFDRIVDKGQFSEKYASGLIREISEAILFLHNNNIVHRDLKPENLIYKTLDTNSPIKITDFGLSKYLKSKTTMKTACGTPGYVAPEILKNEKYGKKVDSWSIGVITYILLCGFPPFYSENTNILYSKIKKGEYSFPNPYWSKISKEAINLIKHLLTVDPEQRYSVSELLQHPWITSASTPDQPFEQNVTDRLQNFNTRRKLNNGMKMLMAVNSLRSLLKCK